MALTPPTPDSRLRLSAIMPNLPETPEQLLEWAEKFDAAFADRDAEIAALLSHYIVHAGTSTISGASTSTTVTLGAQEDDASYSVIATVNDLTDASPVAGSTTVWVDDIATTGFTLKLEAAPGGADVVTVSWIMIR